jgi:hypothetical protein
MTFNLNVFQKILLEELGFQSLVNDLRVKYLTPIFSHLYPEWVDKSVGFDSHKAFVVEYRTDGDTSLNYHYDNAEVTLNISLGWSDFRLPWLDNSLKKPNIFKRQRLSRRRTVFWSDAQRKGEVHSFYKLVIINSTRSRRLTP